MGRLKSADYIFILGFLILIGIAGSVIYMVFTAPTTDKDKNKKAIPLVRRTPKTPDNKTIKKNGNNSKPYRRPKLSNEIVWPEYEKWAPVVDLKNPEKLIKGIILNWKNRPVDLVEVGLTPVKFDKEKLIMLKNIPDKEEPQAPPSQDLSKYEIPKDITPVLKTRTNNKGEFSFPSIKIKY